MSQSLLRVPRERLVRSHRDGIRDGLREGQLTIRVSNTRAFRPKRPVRFRNVGRRVRFPLRFSPSCFRVIVYVPLLLPEIVVQKRFEYQRK